VIDKGRANYRRECFKCGAVLAEVLPATVLELRRHRAWLKKKPALQPAAGKTY
jgi:hypothetical protein